MTVLYCPVPVALDLPRFYRAANPSRPLRLVQVDDRQYYIDFSSVRGGDIVRELERTITLLSPDESTTQLFTGNIGCGKSTELLRLKAQLEQQGLHVVYFESDQDLEMADVDIGDVLLAIARRISQSLEGIDIGDAKGLRGLLQRATKLLMTEIELEAEATVPVPIKTPGMSDISASASTSTA